MRTSKLEKNFEVGRKIGLEQKIERVLKTALGIILMGASLTVLADYLGYRPAQPDVGSKSYSSDSYKGYDEQLKQEMDKYLKEKKELGEWYFDVKQQEIDNKELDKKGFEMEKAGWGYNRIKC